MSNSESNPENKYQAAGGRPYVTYSGTTSVSVGDQVLHMTASGVQGPYTVETVSSGRCTLCYQDGTRVNGGAPVEVTELQPL